MASHPKSGSLEPRRLMSGNYVDRCDDCGNVIIGATPDEVLGAACGCNGGRTVQYLIELVCMMCGREVSTLTVPRPDSRVLIPRSVRCPVCGGSPAVSNTYRSVSYPKLPHLQARIGRPPKKEYSA